MANLINAIFHGLFAFCLLYIWFIPVFSVTLRDKYENEKKRLKASIVLMMILKYFWPNSQVKLLFKK